MSAYVEGKKLYPDENKFVLLSVGCGHCQQVYPFHTDWGVVQWASPVDGVPILGTVSDGQSATADYELNYLLNVRPNESSFFRLQFPLDPNSHKMRIDDISRDNLTLIESAVTTALGKPEMAKVMSDIVATLP